MDKSITFIKTVVAALFVSGMLALIGLIVMLILGSASGQTHTMPGSNTVPSGASLTINSGASLTINSGGSITAAPGSTVTGFGTGGGSVSITATAPIVVTPSPLVATGVVSLDPTTKTNWDTAYADRLKWDGGTTDAVAGRSSLGLVIGTNVQAFDADLTTWAGVTPTSGIQTWLATPSSANLRAAVTDENGTGALLFSGATAPDFTTGFTIGAVAAAGKIPIGNGTNYVPSTPTWPTTAGTASYLVRSDATNFVSYPAQILGSSTSDNTGFTADQYLTGSAVTVAAGDFKAGGQYRCKFDMVKTGGTAAMTIDVRIGTLGTTGDTSRMTFTFGAGTAVADTGEFEVDVNWRSVGSGTSAVISGYCRATHNLATTGLFSNAAAWTIVGTTSAGFASNTATKMGLSVNGGASFGGTNKVVQASLQQ
jgi:hypothetical protein